VLADNRIVLSADADRAVLCSNVLDGADENARVFDVFSVRENRAGERLLLTAERLMGLIENVLKFGVAVEHALIEVRGKRNTVFAKHGDSSFDELNLAGSQHGQESPVLKNSWV